MNVKALFKCSYGIYVIFAKAGEEVSGCVVNTVTQITAEEKPKLMVAVNKENYTHFLMSKSKKVNISVIEQEAPFELIGRFGFRTGKEYDKWKNSKTKMGKNAVPVLLENTTAYMECKIIEELDCNTHTLFLLEMEEAEVLNEKTPMTYDYYHNVLKGFTPPKASTYQERKK